MTNLQVCIDANIIVWSFVPFPLSDAAQALLYSCQEADMELIAPALLAFEVTSSLRRLVYLKHIRAEQGEIAFRNFLDLGIQLVTDEQIYARAWELAKQFNRSRAYDTAYLALAQLTQCDMWTADEKLYNAVHAKLPWVKWLGNYAP